MNKSHYADPTFENHGFINHIHHRVVDCGVIPGTATPLLEAYKIELVQNLSSLSGSGGKPRNIALFRKILGADPTLGTWQLLRMWSEKASPNAPGDYDDAGAAGTVDVLPDGTVHIVLSFGKRTATGALQFQPWEAMVPRAEFAAPIQRLSAQGILFAAPVVTVAWTNRTVGSGELVNIPAVFGVPSSSAYLIRFAGIAGSANVRVRAGSPQAPAILTLNTQEPNLEMHIQGWAPGPSMWISTVNGPAQVWLQICGMA